MTEVVQFPERVRGRRAPARPRHVFKDTGIEVELNKISPLTMQRIAESVRREAKALPEGHEHRYPEAPVETVEIGGEVRQERNERHPDHLEALERWGKWAMNEVNERFIRIAAVDAVVPVDQTDDEIAEQAARVRRRLKAEGVELPYFEQYTPDENDRIVWVQHVAIGSSEDLQEFYQALTQRTAVTEEGVAAHVATFPPA